MSTIERSLTMAAGTEAKGAAQLSLAQTAPALLRQYFPNRLVLAVLAVAVVGAGLALNWSWLVAAGIAPILVALAPCAAMCALGLCMREMGGKSCSAEKNGAAQQSVKKEGQ
jgi:hypothetical protein